MALQAEAQTKIKERLSCALCLEIYKLPQMLPCFHSFCKTCIEKLKRKNKGLECPLCRKFVQTTEIKANFFLNDFSQLIKEIDTGDNICGQCDKTGSTWKCIDCKILLCQQCFNSHLKIPVCKAHKVVQIERDEDIAILDKLVFCYQHPDEIIKFHCKTCQQPICIQCKILDHDSHSAESVDSAVADIISQIAKIKDTYRETIADKQKDKAALEISKSEINKRFLKVKSDVKATTDALIKRITADNVRISNQMEKERVRQIASVDKHASELDSSIKESQSICDWATTLVEKSKGATLMKSYYSGLNVKFDSLNKIEHLTNPIRNLSITYPKFQENCDIATRKSLIGAVAYDSKDTKKLNNKTPKTKLKVAESKEIINIREFFLSKPVETSSKELLGVYTNPHSMALVANTIWIPVESKKKILLVSLKDNLQESLCSPDINPMAVAEIKPHRIALASQQGLWFAEQNKLTWEILDEGVYQAVSHENTTLAAFCSSTNEVRIYQASQEGCYVCMTRIACKSGAINMQLANDHIYLHSRYKRTVEKYTTAGKCVATISTKLQDYTPNEAAKLCLVDERENFLFLDWNNCHMEVHTNGKTQQLRGIQTIFTPEMTCHNDLFFLDNKTLVILAGRKLHFFRSNPVDTERLF